MLIGFRVKAAAPPGKIGPPERSKSCRQAQPRMSQPSTRSSLWHQAARRCLTALGCSLVAAITWAQPPVLDAALRNRIDAFVEHERQASGIPGIALAIVQLGSPAHVRGFGDDGRGKPISADTPFPVSYTHLDVYKRQTIGGTRGQTAMSDPFVLAGRRR